MNRMPVGPWTVHENLGVPVPDEDVGVHESGEPWGRQMVAHASPGGRGDHVGDVLDVVSNRVGQGVDLFMLMVIPKQVSHT